MSGRRRLGIGQTGYYMKRAAEKSDGRPTRDSGNYTTCGENVELVARAVVES